MNKYLGIDLGTSSVKVVACGADGRIEASASADYPIFQPFHGATEQNPEDWYAGVLTAIKKLAAKTDISEIRGVGFSGQMHGLVALDEYGAVVRPAILWNDQRTVAETDFLNDVVGKDKLIAETGNIALTGFTAPKILWLKNHEPLNLARIAQIMLPKDYIAFRLTGRYSTDVSDASGTLLFDVKNKKWSEFMLKAVGLNSDVLPAVYESSAVVGSITEKAAKETGLSADTRVVAGAGDQAAGAVGVGAVEDGAVSVSLGTSGVVFAACDDYPDCGNGELHCFCHADGKYHRMGVTLSAAGSLAWWRSITGEQDFSLMDKEAAKSTDENAIFIPYLNGERSPVNAPSAKGCFFGLTSRTTRGDMSKAVMEGVCFSLKDCLETMKQSGLNPKRAKVTGGGSKSDVWLQLLANALGLELSRSDTAEGGARGAAILAMVGCGEYPSVVKACGAIVKNGASFVPDGACCARSEEKFKKYKFFRSAVMESEKI